jgi:hypothetical protein
MGNTIKCFARSPGVLRHHEGLIKTNLPAKSYNEHIISRQIVSDLMVK